LIAWLRNDQRFFLIGLEEPETFHSNTVLTKAEDQTSLPARWANCRADQIIIETLPHAPQTKRTLRLESIRMGQCESDRDAPEF